MTKAERYVQLFKLAGSEKQNSCDYQAAMYLLSANAEIYKIACCFINGNGIDFLAIKEKTVNFSEQERFVVDVAHNLFSYNSVCKVTPFEIARGMNEYFAIVINSILISAEQLTIKTDAENPDKLVLEPCR